MSSHELKADEISDKDGFIQPLNIFIKKDLKCKEDIDYCNYCLNVIQNKKLSKKSEKEKNRLLKRCKICKGFENRKNIIFCYLCQDAYHLSCVDIKEIKNNSYVCDRCNTIIKNKEKENRFKQLKLDDMFSTAKSHSIFKITNIPNKCNKCKNVLPPNTNYKTCEKCQLKYHDFCFRKGLLSPLKSNKILCYNCETKINNQFKNTIITDYFKQNNNFLQNKREKSKEDNDAFDFEIDEIQRDFDIFSVVSFAISSSSMSTINKTQNDPHLKLPRTSSKSILFTSQKSLFRALETKNIIFSDDLMYPYADCPKRLNNALLQPNIQTLSKYNKNIYYKFKESSRRGIYGPVEVVDDPIQKFIVKALDNISQNTIVCEYSGEVSLLRNKLLSENDSIMDLIISPNSDSSLIILTEIYGNLARFLSGINNFNSNKKKKQNVYSIRVNIDGSIHVLLITMKKIKKGEILYYDYNAALDNYPTNEFV